MIHTLKPVAPVVDGAYELTADTRLPLGKREQMIVDAGRMIWGDRWMRRLATESGLSHAFVTYLAHGWRPLSKGAEAKILPVLDREIRRLTASTKLLLEIRTSLSE
jgi:hypothetical protein